MIGSSPHMSKHSIEDFLTHQKGSTGKLFLEFFAFPFILSWKGLNITQPPKKMRREKKTYWSLFVIVFYSKTLKRKKDFLSELCIILIQFPKNQTSQTSSHLDRYETILHNSFSHTLGCSIACFATEKLFAKVMCLKILK